MAHDHFTVKDGFFGGRVDLDALWELPKVGRIEAKQV
jgi:hypothetical protein